MGAEVILRADSLVKIYPASSGAAEVHALDELAAHLIVALPLGILGGYFMARGIMAGIDTELYRLPVVIYPRTYGFAALTVIGSGVVSALFAMRQLDQLDLVGALKARD